MKNVFFSILFLFALKGAFATDTLTVHNRQKQFISSKNFELLEDPTGKADIRDVINSTKFHATDDSLPLDSYNADVIWLKIILKNKTNQPYIPITIKSSIIDDLDLYFKGTNSHDIIHLASHYPSHSFNQVEQNLSLINCVVLPDSSRTIFLRIKSTAGAVLPVEFHSADSFTSEVNSENVIIGAFAGIMAIMAIYNLILLFIVKDISYLYYVVYIIFLGITQLMLKGYGTNLISGDKMFINDYVMPVSRVFLGYSILMFVYEFLHIRENGKTLNRFFWFLVALYTTPLVAVAAGYTHIAYTLITAALLTISVSLVTIGSILYYRGFTPAKLFLIGWTFFFVSVVISVGRSQGLLPYNNFTLYAILYGSALQLILFSSALADKINFYRRQRTESQMAALAIALENEKLITEQNLKLEAMVNERTEALINSYNSLQKSMEEQGSAQQKLIAAEKMASLGQLTAGIAHEINNPINFVSSNIEPLKLDLAEVFDLVERYISFEQHPADKELLKNVTAYREKIDLGHIKEEIATLLNGIEEGALRTREIVDSLRTFSRTDEQNLRYADINKAILSALIILRSVTPAYISVTPVLNQLPAINCYPGKLGQVFINIVSNSIHAIKSKAKHADENITIVTNDHTDHISIEFTDTGGGIPEEIRQRIFDPFFTTKDVGEGTGLGLSIVFGIIEQHQGSIEVDPKNGKGATFTIKLPKNLA